MDEHRVSETVVTGCVIFKPKDHDSRSVWFPLFRHKVHHNWPFDDG